MSICDLNMNNAIDFVCIDLVKLTIKEVEKSLEVEPVLNSKFNRVG